jgi:hypothetical protein
MVQMNWIKNMQQLVNRVILMVILLLAPLVSVHAAVTNVTASPANANVAIARSTTVIVTWKVSDVITLVPPVTVSSSQGVFKTATGVTLATTTKTLSRTISASGIVVFSETLLVPESVIYKVYKMGLSSFIYERSFSDGSGSPVSNSITFNITGASGSSFSIDRLSLRFADDQLAKVVKIRESVNVLAEISFTGTGLLLAVWEITDPSSTLGKPVYKPLRVVRQQLSTRQQVTLRSPDLPTYYTGLYQVRLRVTNPETGFSMPMLQFFVSDQTKQQTTPTRLQVKAPKADAIFSPQLQFRWQAVDAAVAYRLEVYKNLQATVSIPELGTISQPGEQKVSATDTPITGMLLPANKTQTVLSPASQRYLTSKQQYLWRVSAIDKNGNIIAVSTLRKIKKP